MKKLTKVLLVRNEETQVLNEEKVHLRNLAIYDIAVYQDGVLVFYEKEDEQILHYPEKELTRFYEEKLAEGPFEFENMYIDKNSSFWATIYAKEKFLPHQLFVLQEQMDFTQDIVTPLSNEEFSAVIL